MNYLVSPITGIVIGIFCGIISGLGIGGGSLLMIWLTVVVGMEQATAQSLNLLYFIPTATAAILIHKNRKQIEWRAVLPAVVFGCMTSAIFSWISTTIEMNALRKLYGVFLVFIGIAELVRKPTRKR